MIMFEFMAACIVYGANILYHLTNIEDALDTLDQLITPGPAVSNEEPSNDVAHTNDAARSCCIHRNGDACWHGHATGDDTRVFLGDDDGETYDSGSVFLNVDDGAEEHTNESSCEMIGVFGCEGT